MKKEAIICIIVITLVIIGNVVTQNNTKKCVVELNGQLQELKAQIIEKESRNEQEKENLKTKSEEIKESWDNMQETLSFYIEHDELEKVETQLVLLTGEMETNLYHDAVPEIEKCQFILEHIADKTALNIKNIF